MRKKAWVVFLCCCPLLAIAQNNTIKGQVKDSLNNPVPLVHIMILQADTFVVGTITDSLGSFVIDNLTAGSYHLKIAAIGYQDFDQQFIYKGDRLDFGVLQLQTESIVLDGVELVGRKKLYERRTNSLIINVEQQITSSGRSTLELLTNTAGVSVSQQSNTLSLNGRGQVAIMVNGKLSRVDGPALLSLLKSMPASEIKHLEVFNNPPAKYEANGSGGMINIMTKSKNTVGTGGTFSFMGGYGKGEKTGVSANFHSQKGKIDWSGSYSFNRNRSPEEWGLQSEFNNLAVRKKVYTTSLRKPTTISHNYSLGLDYGILKNTDVGVALSGYSSKWDMIAFDKVINSNGADELESLDIETNEINHWNHIGGNFRIQQSLGDDHKLIFDYDHLYYHDNNPSSYKIASGFTEIKKKTPITFNIFSLDYSWALSKNVDIEFGAKKSKSKFKNTVEVSSDNGLSSVTQMEERVNALYSSFQFQLGDKTRLATGFRFEHTSNELTEEENESFIRRKYGNLFPNLSIAQQITDRHNLRLNYSKRINRPSFNNLAPFILFLGPDALYSGNANLQPSLIHKIGVEWGWVGKYITLEFIIEEGAIIEFQPRLSENGEQYIFKAENIDKRNILSLSFNVPFSVAPWWQSETLFNYQYETLETLFLDSEFKRNKGMYKLTSSQQFSINPNTRLELSGYYQSSSLFGISTFGARGAFNLGIQHKLKKNSGTLNLSFSNVFASDNWKIKTLHSNPNINTLETYFPESRIMALTYTKGFGANKKKSKRGRTSADEEKKRIN
ncbi:TonB-dependent receptor [Flagellimonas sp. S3867]|uniref:TonB-dependent receptor n=1 Tax=Flagellimonas sp. S3867 TaxID=2768063 RepID=UPI001685D5CB|nr:TonB-dependent receptor [Flagellimonas sp. S3867]